MCVGAWAQNSCDEELRLGKLLSQHGHERDGAAFTHVHGWTVEVGARGRIDGLLEPWRQGWGIPTAGGAGIAHGHRAAIGWIACQGARDRSQSSLGVYRG